MNIYTICPNPFYFEILIKSFSNEDDLKQNIKYIKEILDVILSLEYIDPNNNNPLKKEITIFNTIQFFQIYFIATKNKQNISNNKSLFTSPKKYFIVSKTSMKSLGLHFPFVFNNK